ncbi:MAG: S8 family serine peptidase [Lewinella sp.]|nr:S8 family serine peptidase [Lewinella sp.]
MRQLVLWCLLCMVSNAGFSQANLAVHLNNFHEQAPELQPAARELTAWPRTHCFAEECYAVIQFTDIPTNDQVLILRELGLRLYDFIPNYAFLASVSRTEYGVLPDYVRAVIPLQPEFKQPEGDAFEALRANVRKSLPVVAFPLPGVPLSALAEELELLGARLTGLDDDRLHCTLPGKYLDAVLESPLLMFLEPEPPAPQPEGRYSRTSGRVYQANQGPQTGYDGSGIAMAIADDGTINHLDFQGRVVSHTQINTGAHGEMTAGMAIGAGNIQPLAMGMAPAATLHLYDIMGYEHIQQAPANYVTNRVVITSTSFSEGCGDPYTQVTRDIDQQVYQNPFLTHCFSVGNYAENACPNAYSLLGASPLGFYYSTITGGRKAGKNVIAVGNTDREDELRLSSSRGPTYDGRTKPDLVALGQGDLTPDEGNSYRLSSGTSAAAPAVAGAMACLYQYWRESHDDQDPDGALLKAAVLNTADDLGLPGPDFSYGWGRLHLGRALQLLQEEHYLEGNLFHGGQNFFPLDIPAGVSEVKVMLYWHDPAGSLLTPRALVNDLDLTLTSPSGQHSLPWGPSPAKHLDSLAAPAIPRRDRINNVEQVVLANPTAGTYTLEVKGFQVPQPSQHYYVVYHFEYDQTQLVYPAQGTNLVPFEEDLIRWESSDLTSTSALAYSLDGMSSWQPIAQNIPAGERTYHWTPPYQVSDEVFFRLIHGSDTLTSGPAIISPLPYFTIDYHSDTQAAINWDPIPGAAGYEVLALGNTHMEVIGSTAGTQFLAPVSLGEEYWFSLRPVFPSGRKGRRATAQHYQHFGCSQQVNLRIHFDQYPGETSWQILGSEGNTVLSGGPYTGQTPHSEITIPLCLPAGCHTLIMLDSYGDGMCCSNGEGWYALYSSQGNLLGSGSQFGAWTYHAFCPDGSPDPLQLNIQFNQPVSCYGGQNGAVQMEASGGTGLYTYQWSNGGTGPGQFGLVAGTYSVTVTDGNESVSSNVVVTQPAPLTLTTSTTPAYCLDGSATVVAAGGTAPYSIAWGDGSQGWTRQQLAGGAYYAIVTDVRGCLQTATPVVPTGPPLTASPTLTPPPCAQTPTGSIQVTGSGGHGGYQFQWSNGATGPLLSNLSAGHYAYTLTDQGGCSFQSAINLTEPNPINASADLSPPQCAGAADGAISLAVSGGSPPYNYQWQQGGALPALSGLTAGLYSLTITDIEGCERAFSYELTDPAALVVATNLTPASAAAAGTASLTISGGTPPYLIQWDHGPTATHLSELEPGTYHYTVVDQQGCARSGQIVIQWEGPPIGPVTPVYCTAQGSSTAFEWIAAVSLGNFQWTSGNDGGYGDHTATHIPVTAGETYTLQLTPQYLGTQYNENWRVWVDYNGDGDFTDANELVAALGPQAGPISTSITIPATALAGPTRLRVAMQYGLPPMLCQNVGYGEVEDYTLDISAGAGDMRPAAIPATPPATAVMNNWRVYPNPTAASIELQGHTTEGQLRWLLLDGQGQAVRQGQQMVSDGSFRTRISLDDLSTGIYLLHLVPPDGQVQTLRISKIGA